MDSPVHRNRVLLAGDLATRPSPTRSDNTGPYQRMLLTVRVSAPLPRSDVLPVDVYRPRPEVAAADQGTPVTVEARTVLMSRYDPDGVWEWIRLVADKVTVGEAEHENRVLVAGTVDSRSPLRQFREGSTSMILHIAVSDRDRSDVLPVTVWNPDPELVSAEPGTPVTVRGQVHRSFWTDSDGRHSRVTLIAHQVTIT